MSNHVTDKQNMVHVQVRKSRVLKKTSYYELVMRECYQTDFIDSVFDCMGW